MLSPAVTIFWRHGSGKCYLHFDSRSGSFFFFFKMILSLCILCFYETEAAFLINGYMWDHFQVLHVTTAILFLFLLLFWLRRDFCIVPSLIHFSSTRLPILAKPARICHYKSTGNDSASICSLASRYDKWGCRTGIDSAGLHRLVESIPGLRKRLQIRAQLEGGKKTPHQRKSNREYRTWLTFDRLILRGNCCLGNQFIRLCCTLTHTHIDTHALFPV